MPARVSEMFGQSSLAHGVILGGPVHGQELFFDDLFGSFPTL